MSILRKAVVKNARLQDGTVVSNYLDCRLVTLTPDVLMIASVLLDALSKFNLEAIGGPTLGADPILGAMAAITQSKNNSSLKSFFIVRSEAKKYGTGKIIEGPAISGKQVALIDDVLSSGATLLSAAQSVRREGGNVAVVATIAERNFGGRQLLESEGIPVISLFSVDEITGTGLD